MCILYTGREVRVGSCIVKYENDRGFLVFLTGRDEEEVLGQMGYWASWSLITRRPIEWYIEHNMTKEQYLFFVGATYALASEELNERFDRAGEPDRP